MGLLHQMFQISNFNVMYEAFRTAMGGVEWFFAAYMLCLAAFFVIGKDQLKNGFLYPFLFMAVTVFNPFLMIPVGERIGLLPRIRRIFWLIPINLTLAFSFVHLLRLSSGWLRKGLTLFLCVAFIVWGGTFVKPYLHMPQNIYKTSNEIIAISDLIDRDAEEHNREKYALFAKEELFELRQYNPSIMNHIRRVDMLNWKFDPGNAEGVEKVVKSGHVPRTMTLLLRYHVTFDREVFLKEIKKIKTSYIITETSAGLQEYLTSVSCTLLDTIGEYEVYRVDLEE